MSETVPDIYNMTLFDAAAATSAAPLYWELKSTPLPGGDAETLIDGGVIENNPAIYAESLALVKRMQRMKEEGVDPMKEKSRPIRMISIGTGGSKEVNQFSSSKYSTKNKLSLAYWWQQASYLSMAAPQSYSTFSSAYDGIAANHLRMDLHSTISMADATKADALVQQGVDLAVKYQGELDTLAAILVEERKHLL